MTSVIIRGVIPTSHRGIVHGAKPIHAPVALSPTSYVERLNSIYEENYERISSQGNHPIVLSDIRDDLELSVKIQSNDEVPTWKSILQHLSVTTRGKFWPENFGVAYPISIDIFRRLTMQIGNIAYWRTRGPWHTDWAIKNEELKRYMNDDIEKHMEFHYILECLRGRIADHKGTEMLYCLGIDMEQRSYPAITGKVVDTSLMTDPHILFLHPQAVRWF